MPIYVNGSEAGKLYVMANPPLQIGKVYRKDAGSSSLIYSGELNVLAEGNWTKAGNESFITSLTAENVVIRAAGSGGNARVYKIIDATAYSTLTITCDLSQHYGFASVGLFSSEPDYMGGGEMLAGKVQSDSVTSGTFTFDISAVSGYCYAAICAYCGTSASSGHGTAVCSKFILE